MTIYLLPGLGADERLFQYLKLGDHEIIPIHWISPTPDDTIENYAAKIALQISGHDNVLIGQSFGGIMAVEIGKIMPFKKIIIISSMISSDELPRRYRIAGLLRLNKILTPGLLKRSHVLINWVMGAVDPLRRKLLADMLRDSDEKFMSWSLQQILDWKNRTVPPNMVCIHGDNDKVLPLRRAEYVIKGGGHLIVANRADEVSAAIKEILTPIEGS
ncbi:MAG: alpha/beta hydrolase [Bacteroidota bacterium]